MGEPKSRKRGRPAGGPDRDARRLELLAAATEAIRREGVEVSMDTIAAEAGVTKPILYSHFGDKAGLTAALVEQIGADLRSLLVEETAEIDDPREFVRSTIDGYVSLFEAEPNIYRFVTSGDASHGRKLVDEVATELAVVLGARLRAAGKDSGAAEPWAYAIVGMVDWAGDWWLDRKTMSRADLAEYLTMLVWDGLGSTGISLGSRSSGSVGAG